MTSDEFTSLLLAAPVGVALLQYLEATERSNPWPFPELTDSEPAAVAAAEVAVATSSLSDLLENAVEAADQIAGPWNPTALTSLPNAYRFAPQRAGIARAIADRFTSTLATGIERSAQEWWNTSNDQTGDSAAELRIAQHGHGHGSYCCGEWPWRSAWTVTAPPPELHETLVNAWEMYFGRIQRWRFEVTPSARVFEIHCPDDWRRLVTAYPDDVSGRHGGWELPGVNQHRKEVADVASTSAGAAARFDVRVAMPDWRRVSEDWDGVHLSWAGMLTCEGHVLDLPDLGNGVVTMLRFWFTERTLWLRSSPFSEPSGLPAATMTAGQLESKAASTVDRPLPNFSTWPI